MATTYNLPEMPPFNFPPVPSQQYIPPQTQPPTSNFGHLIFGNAWESIINPINILLFFLVLLIIFLLVREFLCWYWKINKRTKLLEEISTKLTLLLEDNENMVKSKMESDSNKKINQHTNGIN